MTHLSALALDAVELDALGAAAAAEARAHLTACARCRADRDAAAALREHFTVRVLPRAGVPRRRHRMWAMLPVPVLAAAVAAALVLGSRHPRPTDPAEPDLAIKGAPAWQVFANHDGQTFPVHDGTPLAAGDRIRFALVPGGARYVLVASVDGAGAVTVYVPYGGKESAALADGQRVELPGSIVLDAAPGPERLFALLSDEPLAAPAIAGELRAIAAAGPDAIRRPRQLFAAGIRAQLSVVFEKAVAWRAP